jgi:hypothetical protein
MTACAATASVGAGADAADCHWVAAAAVACRAHRRPGQVRDPREDAQLVEGVTAVEVARWVGLGQAQVLRMGEGIGPRSPGLHGVQHATHEAHRVPPKAIEQLFLGEPGIACNPRHDGRPKTRVVCAVDAPIKGMPGFGDEEVLRRRVQGSLAERRQAVSLPLYWLRRPPRRGGRHAGEGTRGWSAVVGTGAALSTTSLSAVFLSLGCTRRI